MDRAMLIDISSCCTQCAHSFTHSVTLLEKLLWVFMSGVLMVLVGYLT